MARSPSSLTSLLLGALALLVAGVSCLDNNTLEQQPIAEFKEALLDPNGPDIGVDPDRLRASMRVITNATVNQAEVDEGCARATSGRTLIRFDVKTPNFGPADLFFGRVSCRSTRTTAECRNVDCSQNAACCCGGQNTCTTSSGRFNEGFEFSCPHGHIHFNSFAEYRLLALDGTVAATGHKQSFCLLDLEGAIGNTCFADSFFTCGNQGIHAGCADVYSQALPCSYVDATNVPEGEYMLEVTIDPQDLINEANESNNVTTARVRIGNPPPPPPPPQRQLFLVRDGVGTLDEANAYYAALSPGGFVPGQTTLDDWRTRIFGDAPVVTAFYRNGNELGFWREMTCTEMIARGSGGCTVRNWSTPTDPDQGLPNLGTVAMHLDDQGRTQFFAFNPQGLLSPSATLDSEGPKFLPRLCTNCHGGEYGGAASDPDLGSIFREFEPSQFQPRPGATLEQSDAEWYALNRSIRSANENVRVESEGAPFGTAAAAAAINSYISEIYVSESPPTSRPVGDPAHVPASWLTGSDAEERFAKSEMWTRVVNPYCMTCHRSNGFNYNNYQTFATVAVITNGRPLLRRYIEVDPNDPDRTALAFMPQSRIELDNLNTDAEALIAIERWLNEVTNRAPIAQAGADQTVPSGQTVELSAAGSSDPDGDPLLYRWERVSGPDIAFLSGNTGETARFVTPEVNASTPIVIRLVVSDTRMGETEDRVTVTVLPRNTLVVVSQDTPINIPDNRTAGIASTINIDRNLVISSLSMRVEITHSWIGDLRVELTGPGGFSRVLHNRSGRDADDIMTTYLVTEAIGRRTAGAWQLRVSDLAGADVGVLRSWSMTIQTAEPAPNRAPLADAGTSRTVRTGVTVALSASASTDPDGDTVTYRWQQTSGQSVTLTPSLTARDVSFTAPSVAANTPLVFALVVRDPAGLEGRVEVTITVTPAGGPIRVSSPDTPIVIPDNTTRGVTSRITVAGQGAINDLQVSLRITHTYVGDLRIELRGPGGFSRVLHNRSGGSRDDIDRTYSVTEAIGRDAAGNWELVVSDRDAADSGTLQAWSMLIGR